MFNWLVVSNIVYVHPYLEKIPILTNIFQMGWNHQPVWLDGLGEVDSFLLTEIFVTEIETLRFDWHDFFRRYLSEENTCFVLVGE